MMIDVTLRVSGIDLEDQTIAEILGTRFPDLLWQGEGKHMTVTFTVTESDAPAEALERVRALQANVPTFRALRADRDLVSTTEIALRVGVSREAARKWSKEEDFPAPIATIGNMNVWLWCEVLAWLDESRGIDMDEHPPTEAMLVQIDNCLLGNPDATSMRWHQLSMSTKEVPATLRNRRRVPAWTPSASTVRVGAEGHVDLLLMAS